MKNIFAILTVMLPTAALAGNDVMRQADVHKHGSHMLEIAAEKNEILIVYRGPIADFHDVEGLISEGSESAAAKLLSKLVTMNAEAKCEPEHVHLTVKSVEDGHAQHSDQEVHTSKNHKNENHSGHGEHEAHDNHNSEEGHKDVIVEAHFQCEDADALKNMTIDAFDSLDKLERLDVDLITNKGARELFLDKDNRNVEL